MMNKSIFDYKNEMDKIEISENFVKRTEQMMAEQSTITINKKPIISWQKTITIFGTSAACVALIFAMNARKNSVDKAKEIVETIVCATETTNQVSISNFDEDIVNDDSEVEMIVAIEEDMVAFTELNIELFDSGGGDEEKNGVADAEINENRTTNVTENSSTTQEVNPVSVQNEISDNTVVDINELFPFFINDVDYSTSKIGIVSHINDNTKSLKIIYTENDAQKMASDINVIISNAKTATKISSSTLFNIMIDTTSEDNYFEMSLAENKQFTIIGNYPDGVQKVTFQLNDDEYFEMEKLLYTVFSSPSEYEEYSALKSGK